MDIELKEKLTEILAELSHKQWAGWMKYLFSKCVDPIHHTQDGIVIPLEFVQRWVRQANTEYKDLPEEEKVSDRKEAEKIIEVLPKNLIKLLWDE